MLLNRLLRNWSPVELFDTVLLAIYDELAAIGVEERSTWLDDLRRRCK